MKDDVHFDALNKSITNANTYFETTASVKLLCKRLIGLCDVIESNPYTRSINDSILDSCKVLACELAKLLDNSTGNK